LSPLFSFCREKLKAYMWLVGHKNSVY